jgi:hypothetical protein
MALGLLEELTDRVAGLGDGELTARFRVLELQRREVEAEMAAIVAEGERRAVCAVDGHASMKQWVLAHTNGSAADATRLRRLATTMSVTPVVGEALAAGRIGMAQAYELARVGSNRRVTEAFAAVVPTLVRHAEHLGFGEFRVVCQRFEMLADLDGVAQRDDASFEGRTASVVDVDGSLHVRARGGTGEATARLIGIFDKFVEVEFAKDVAARTAEFGADAPASKLARTDAQRRHDAFVAIFDAAVSAPADGVAPEPVVNVVVDYRTLQDLLAEIGAPDIDTVGGFRQVRPDDLLVGRMESSTGVPLAPDAVVAACISGVVRTLVVDPAGVVVSAGRKRRLFTGAAREVALVLRHGCGHLGCTVRAGRCEVDHLKEWDADGGCTDQDNAWPRCKRHNPFKSKRRIRSVRDPDGYLIDFRADGTPILPAGRRLTASPPGRPPDQPDAPPDTALGHTA